VCGWLDLVQNYLEFEVVSPSKSVRLSHEHLLALTFVLPFR
jgi:hypothetical protein